MIPIIYYAHSMMIYGTEREKKELAMLQDYFRTGVVYNPNRSFIQEAKNPMKLCLDVLSDPHITCLAFSHSGRIISSGVYAEIRTAQKKYKSVHIINRDEIHPYGGTIVVLGRDRKTEWAKV